MDQQKKASSAQYGGEPIPFLRHRRRARVLAALSALAVLCVVLVLIRSGGQSLFVLTGSSSQPPVAVTQPLQFGSGDRVLILAPHPDDESLATDGVIQQAIAMGLPVRVVFLTYGDANQWSFALYRKRPELGSVAVEGMGLVRQNEALAATALLGLKPDNGTFLGYPDLGTLAIFGRHWRDQPPLRAVLSRATAVPYASALSPGAPYKGEQILGDLETVLRQFRPTVVFMSHSADHNPDHEALYLFTRVALWDLSGEIQPRLSPYLVHYPRWPEPRGAHPARASLAAGQSSEGADRRADLPG